MPNANHNPSTSDDWSITKQTRVERRREKFNEVVKQVTETVFGNRDLVDYCTDRTLELVYIDDHVNTQLNHAWNQYQDDLALEREYPDRESTEQLKLFRATYPIIVQGILGAVIRNISDKE